jgi:zinc protease
MVKKIILFSILIMTFFGFTSKTINDKILPYQILQHKMSNGLNVVTVPYNSPGIVAFHIVVRAGSRNEVESGVTGFAHFFEHMMFRGTDKYPKDKYEEILKSIGASANANTSLDRTMFHMLGDAGKLELMFEIESDRFQNLHYSEHDFKVEAGAVKGEYTKNFADPLEQLDESICEVAFDKHTYKHTTMGFFKDIVDMPNQYEYSLKFYKRFYRPEYCTIVVVGDVTQEKVNALSEKYFGKWESGNYVADITTEPVQQETKFAHIKNGETPPFISLNFKGPAFSDNSVENPSLDIISSVYFSQRSELYKKLVLSEKKLRYLRCYQSNNRDPNLISVDASVKKKDDLQYVKDEILKTIENIKSTPIDEKTLADAKSNLMYSLAMRLDNPGAIANSLSAYVAISDNPEAINNYYAMFDKVTPEEIMNTAKKYFVTTGLTIGTITADDEVTIN